MECSKCRTVKERSFFYATGKVCKDCKRNYSRTYRSSRTADARSTESASVRSVDDYMQATEDAIMERLQSIETNVVELRDAMSSELATLRTNMHHAFGGILERLRRIDEVLSRLDGRISTARRGSISSHPIAEFV